MMSVEFKNGESNHKIVCRNALLILLQRVIEEQGRSTNLLLFDWWWYSFALSSSKVLQDRCFFVTSFIRPVVACHHPKLLYQNQ